MIKMFKKHMTSLPHKGDKGTNIAESIQKHVRKLLTGESATQVMYTGKKFSS